MIREVDPLGRIIVSYIWAKKLSDSTVIVSAEKGKLIIKPYNPKKHNLDVVLSRHIDDHGRIRLASDIYRAAGLSTKEGLNVYIAPDDTVIIRNLGSYCDVCGKETKTKMVLGRNICQSCFEKLKRCE